MVKTKVELLQDGLEVQLNSLHHLDGAVLLPPPAEAMLPGELLAFSTPRKVLELPPASLTQKRAPEELLVFLSSESALHLLLPRFHHQDFLWRPPAGL